MGEDNLLRVVEHVEREAVASDLDDAEARHLLGRACEQLGLYADASAAYEEAASLEPEEAVHHRKVGLLAHKLGENDKAIQSLKKATSFKSADIPPTRKPCGHWRVSDDMWRTHS